MPDQETAPETVDPDIKGDETPIIDINEAAEVTPVVYSITSYGIDYPVDSLVKRIESGNVVVPTFQWDPPESSKIVGFQRGYMWPRTKSDRFIESLLLGLPVPGIFLVKEPSGLLLVLDGHQRLYSLYSFYRGVIGGREYRLRSVQPQYEGLRYEDLEVEDRRRLDDSIIHATVIRQDEPSEDQSSIYAIFERLNTGGINLLPQEIRVALYHGDFVRLLDRLNDYKPWRHLYGQKSKRLKDLEMILRFFALYYGSGSYRRPMKDFLNHYMAANRNLDLQNAEELEGLFTSVVDAVDGGIGLAAFRPYGVVNAAAIDSVMFGVARRLSQGTIEDSSEMADAHSGLLSNPDYEMAIGSRTSDESSVAARLDLATAAFSTIP